MADEFIAPPHPAHHGREKMLFNTNSGAFERRAKAIALLAFVVWLVTISSAIYVAAHFIAKFW